MKHQPFEVQRDGMTIRGMCYVPSGVGRFPTVLMLHGFTGQRIESGFLFVQLARALVKQGIAAVTFDFLHSGESDGSFDQMLVTGELADAMRITDWVRGQPFVDRSRLGLLGFSLGGLLACCVTGRTDAYRALVLLAPTTVANMSRHAGERGGGERVAIGPHQLHPQFFDDMRTLDPVGDCVRHPRPTLLVQGTADKAVPPEVSMTFVDAMRQADVPVTLRTIAEADHSFSKPPWRTMVLDEVVRWTGEQLMSNV